MLEIKTKELLKLIQEEFVSMKKCQYSESSTYYLGQVDGVEFQLTFTKCEDEYFDDPTVNEIITKGEE